MADVVYITTPIYYVNDRPHIGHAYTTVLGDVLARYQRLLGRVAFYLTGTDEHGQKVQEAAARAGVDPQRHCDEYTEHFKALWQRLDIHHDDYIRTTEERHRRVVRALLTRLHEKGEIYRGRYEGFYCVPDENFWTEKDLVDGRCPDCKGPVERRAEDAWFFKLSKYRDWLTSWVEAHETCVFPPSRRNEVRGFLKQPLGDLCISRPKERLSWGIPLPFDPAFVCYVWFDALINYISAVGATGDDGEARFRRHWPAAYHIIGKDILVPSHAVYWPCMLHAAGYAPATTLLAHGWWLSGGKKMSKRDGNVVDPHQLIDRYGSDAFRYYVLREMVLGQDADVTPESFHRRYTADLANDLGNLASRTLNMVEKYRDGRVPAPYPMAEGDEERRLRVAAEQARMIEDLIDGLKFNQILQRVWDLLGAANAYIDRKQPWKLAKADKPTTLDTVLYGLVETLRIASVLIHPVMPRAAGNLRERLGQGGGDPTLAEAAWREVWTGSTALVKGEPLFPRIDA